MAIPARVSLGITAILTIIILCGNVNAEMPPVSYIKAQDYFLLGSFAFIFISFVEFVIVLNTHPDPRWFRCLKRSICRIRKSVKVIIKSSLLLLDGLFAYLPVCLFSDNVM